MSAIKSLGYVGFEVSDLEAWRKFAADVLGIQVESHDNGALRMRVDDRALRIVAYKGTADDLGFAGWEVADDAALEAEAKRLKAAGIDVAWGSDTEARFRCVKRFFRFKDPEGTPLEMFYGADKASTPFKSEKIVSEFVTGPQGLGHIVLACRDLKAVESFYRDVLGFKLTDYIIEKIDNFMLHITFLHVNPRHHSLALAGVPRAKKKLDHLMIQVAHTDDVGFGYDRVRDTKAPVVATLGRHPNDQMFSFYVGTPSGFSIEFGMGARTIDDEKSWKVETYPVRSDWGHRPPERSEIAQGWARQRHLKEKREAAAKAGEKQPQH